MIRQPPRSTLFPYPTLSRSLVSDRGARRFTRPRLDTTSTHGTGCTLSAAVAAGLALGRPLEQAVAEALDFVPRAMADRKSTRLNSSHSQISYAVFCLNKKKQ